MSTSYPDEEPDDVPDEDDEDESITLDVHDGNLGAGSDFS